MPPRNFEDAYSSEDSEDEKNKLKKLNLPPVVRLEDTSFGKQKSQREKDEQNELKLHNLLAFQKRKKQDLLREMIIKGTSLAKTTQQALKNSKDKKDLFKKG